MRAEYVATNDTVQKKQLLPAGITCKNPCKHHTMPRTSAAASQVPMHDSVALLIFLLIALSSSLLTMASPPAGKQTRPRRQMCR